MKHLLCQFYELCINAMVALRCLVPRKHSTSDLVPYCFKQYKEVKNEQQESS